jgi:hypothetical protein
LAKVARPAELPKINKLTGKIVRDDTNTSTKHDVKPSGEQAQPKNADVSIKKSRATVAQLAEEFARDKQAAVVTINDEPPPAEARVYSMEIPEHMLQQDVSTTIDEQNDNDEMQFDDEQQTIDDKDESAARTRRSRKRVRVRNRQTEQQIDDIATVERRADPIKFATWLPPTQQTGDGRTSLNDKLGY